jgi:GNAT superfamily N-acetyltransferase
MNIEHQPKRSLEIRRHLPGEEMALQEIYFEATRRSNSRDYTSEQVERWVANHADLVDWTSRLAGTKPFVAVIDGRPIAFGELEPNGHIDFFYCHPDWEGRGAGSELIRAIAAEALKLGLKTLHAEVSVTAEPFFAKQGFLTVEVRIPIICGAPAKQYIMRKDIG